MDVERDIESIRIEADEKHNFDDIVLNTKDDEFNFQIKKIQNITLDDLQQKDDNLFICKKKHKLSNKNNVVFVNEIDFESTYYILGIPTRKIDDYFVISHSENTLIEEIATLYNNDFERMYQLQSFFQKCLNTRKLNINLSDLPTVKTYMTELTDKTVNVIYEKMEFENLLHVEGKPGIGKSHYVSILTKDGSDTILYRFWISNQDNDYENRLKYRNFISDLSKKVFHNYILRSENEILEELNKRKYTLILDGLDHIENYNHKDFDLYYNFILKAAKYCRTIVLSRPIIRSFECKKVILPNWNFDQTRQVLDELYGIKDINICNEVYRITKGYAILVKFISEHFKLHKKLPELDQLSDVNSYYDKLITKEKGMKALSLFLCAHTFFMESEIEVFLGRMTSVIIFEFIREHPYLFEKQLNRVSLLHDSFTTFLRIKFGVDIELQNQIRSHVYSSIMNRERRFLSRYILLNLTKEQNYEIIKKYSNIGEFEKLTVNTIDFENISDFYFNLRLSLSDFHPEEFELIEYYNLAIICSIIGRSHIYDHHDFMYLLTKNLLCNNYSYDDIVSNGCLFAMLFYIEEHDISLLSRQYSDNPFDSSDFPKEIQAMKIKEDSFFKWHEIKIPEDALRRNLHDTNRISDENEIVYILVNSYIYKDNHRDYSFLFKSIELFRKNKKQNALELLLRNCPSWQRSRYLLHRYLNLAIKELQVRNIIKSDNIYSSNSMDEFLKNRIEMNNFELINEVKNFLRMANNEKRIFDIEAIYPIWLKYHNRRDYSLQSIPNALTVFELKSLIKEEDSIRFIKKVQDVSEKDYKHLLNEYMENHSSKIVEIIQENYTNDEGIVLWFNLPIKLINCISNDLFDRIIFEELEHRIYSHKFDYKNIVNVLKSEKKTYFLGILKEWKFRININSNDFGKLEIPLEYKDLFKIKDAKEEIQLQNEHQKIKILHDDDTEYIERNHLLPEEVACYHDGHGFTLAYIDLYSVFPKELIRRKIKTIIYNAISSKSLNSNYFHRTDFFLGNMLKLMYDNELDIDVETYWKSYNTFIRLSNIG